MAEPTRPALAFSRRAREDGASDSICRHCFATIATSIWEDELDRAEREHLCDPARLARFSTPERRS